MGATVPFTDPRSLAGASFPQVSELQLIRKLNAEAHRLSQAPKTQQ
jgi:hypothetical protein